MHLKLQENYMKCGKCIKLVHIQCPEVSLLDRALLQSSSYDHWKHHSSHLEVLSVNMKSILGNFMRALPVKSRLFSDPWNEMVGKLVSNGCQEQNTCLVL